jgi:hypothetical protein
VFEKYESLNAVRTGWNGIGKSRRFIARENRFCAPPVQTDGAS